MANYRRHQDLILFKRINQLKMPVYNKGGKLLGLPIENSDKVFMFTTDNDLKTDNFFIPDVSIPKLSEEYYSVVNTKLN